MADFIDALVNNARETIDEGYYDTALRGRRVKVSLREAIVQCKRAAIIAEIKPTSPSLGPLREVTDVRELARAMKRGGCVGISVLTEPKSFHGSLRMFVEAREAMDLPLLMKDIIISPLQIEAAERVGANVILLIKAVYDRKLGEESLEEMMAMAKSMGIEVLLETHTREEFLSALATNADMIGINNRDLTTQRVDLEVTGKILKGIRVKDRVVVSESGISTRDDLRHLQGLGAHAFLVGTLLMKASDVEGKTRELVEAL